MVEPDKKKDLNKAVDLEDTVRNLREENAKLLQLLRAQGLHFDPSNGKSNDSISSTLNHPSDTTNITFDHSDLTLTTNSINTTNQTNHQHINNHGSTNQQNYNEQTIHGNQSNITPNFNTVIQSTTQPFVQNNSNTLVQNNTNLIQPINLVNFNNVSIDSIQSFFASQNSVMYLSQTSSTTTTTTTTTTATSANSNMNDSLPSNIHSILPPPPPLQTSSSSSSTEHQISIRPKPSLMHQNQELVPVIPKIRPEHFESITRQLSSSNNDTTNLLDNDSNDSKHKYPRPIRPRPSSRGHSLQTYKSVVVNKAKSSSSSFVNNNSSTVSLFPSPSSSTDYLSQSSSEHQTDHSSQLLHSKSLDLSVLPTNNILSSTDLPTTANQKSNKNQTRNRKKAPASSVIVPSNNQTLVTIAPNLGRPLAPAPVNTQRIVTSNNPITKRATTKRKQVKRNSKTLVQYHSESLLEQNSSSPSNSFAESISGLLENFDQELIASNFLSQTTTTSNLLSDENNSVISSNTTVMGALENNDNGATQRQESYHITIASMPTLDEFNDRLENDTILTNQTTQDYNVENEQITSFMSEEDMRLVEMNFDENTFLKQFDLEDPGIKLSVHSDQNLFANILTTNNDLIQTHQQQQINEQSTLPQNPPLSLPPPIYPGSSLINNNVFTTVVPLGLQQQTSQTNTFINNNSTTRLLPEEGVQLTARHLEPSQVATYESVKYQDILDDLVMVTDQDALRHAQAAAAADPSVVATDFSFALLEATNEMIKNSNMEMVEENSSAFTELQYFYPIEQEQELLQKQLEICHEKQHEILHEQQQPIVILEKLHSQILASAGISKRVLDEAVMNTSITDLSSILQFQSIDSPTQYDTSITELITPIRPTKTISSSSSKSPVHQIDFDSLLPSSKLPNSYANDPVVPYSPISDTLGLSSNSLLQQLQPTDSTEPAKACILFEPISSSSNPPSPTKASSDEMVIDSGCLDDLNTEKTNVIDNDDEIEELLRDTTNEQYEIIENQGQTCIQNHVIIDNVDQLIEQIEPSETTPERMELLEQTFSRYQEKYQLNLQREQEISSQKSHEQSLTIPPVKLKLNSIYPQKSLKMEEERKSPSPEPVDDQPPSVERPRLKITIRTKLPTSISPSEENNQNNKIRKAKKKKSHCLSQHQKKTKTSADQLETEYAGLTRFEQPLAQLYHQQSPPTPDEIVRKDENQTPPPPLPSSQSESQSTTTLHSGFIIDEQTPPSSITSTEHKQSPPPLLLTQTKSEPLKTTYSHLFNYDNNHEHQNNNTYITPPPEIDLNPQQQKTNSYETFCPFSNSPNKKKHHHRKSSVASSSSSKSLSNTDYAIDTLALEPVSPTPISISKQKHPQNQTSSNHHDTSPAYFEHQQQKQAKDYYSRKSSSSSSANRSSRPTSSQIYQQSHSLSNQNYRTAQEPPILPVLLPPPPPIHIDPYAQSYHHSFAPQVAPSPFFNFSFPHPFLNPHPTTAPAHFHPHSMKYHHHHHHHHSSHGYPTHQQQYPYHPHTQRQHQYNNSNYMSSRDHHSFDR